LAPECWPGLAADVDEGDHRPDISLLALYGVDGAGIAGHGLAQGPGYRAHGAELGKVRHHHCCAGAGERVEQLGGIAAKGPQPCPVHDVVGPDQENDAVSR